jgi:hypothetical protein
MPRKKKPADQRRAKLNLTIHPGIRDWADSISGRRRRSISQIFEELVEAEWVIQQSMQAPSQPQFPIPQPPLRNTFINPRHTSTRPRNSPVRIKAGSP